MNVGTWRVQEFTEGASIIQTVIMRLPRRLSYFDHARNVVITISRKIINQKKKVWGDFFIKCDIKAIKYQDVYNFVYFLLVVGSVHVDIELWNCSLLSFKKIVYQSSSNRLYYSIRNINLINVKTTSKVQRINYANNIQCK